MPFSRSISAIAFGAAAFDTPSLALAASPQPSLAPSPSSTPAVGTPTEQLVGASVEIARSLVAVGRWLVVISFAVMILTVILTTPALKDAIKSVADKWVAMTVLRDTEPPAFPYTDLFPQLPWA